jgi:hypothetical protein
MLKATVKLRHASVVKTIIMKLQIQLFKAMAMVAICFVVFSSCKKECNTKINAVITGFDKRLCACCGGLVINFRETPLLIPPIIV